MIKRKIGNKSVEFVEEENVNIPLVVKKQHRNGRKMSSDMESEDDLPIGKGLNGEPSVIKVSLN